MSFTSLDENQNFDLAQQDKIDESLLKIRSMVACLIAVNTADVHLDQRYWYGALWVIDTQLEALEGLIA